MEAQHTSPEVVCAHKDPIGIQCSLLDPAAKTIRKAADGQGIALLACRDDVIMLSGASNALQIEEGDGLCIAFWIFFATIPPGSRVSSPSSWLACRASLV